MRLDELTLPFRYTFLPSASRTKYLLYWLIIQSARSSNALTVELVHQSRSRPVVSPLFLQSRLTRLVVLAAGGVERVGELVCCHGAEGAVLQVSGPRVFVEWRLEDTRREDDLPIRGRCKSAFINMNSVREGTYSSTR